MYGDPHLITLDGYKYTFNGKGEYTLIETKDKQFSIQGRMIEPNIASNGTIRATVFSAIAAKQIDSDVIQFEVIDDEVAVLVDGQQVDLSKINEQKHTNVTVSRKDTSSASATFSSGAYLEVKLENGFFSVLIVSLPKSFKHLTLGLMGSFNDDTSDDLLPKAGSEPLPLDSSIEGIHNMFGVTCKLNHSCFVNCYNETCILF